MIENRIVPTCGIVLSRINTAGLVDNIIRIRGGHSNEYIFIMDYKYLIIKLGTKLTFRGCAPSTPGFRYKIIHSHSAVFGNINKMCMSFIPFHRSRSRFALVVNMISSIHPSSIHVYHECVSEFRRGHNLFFFS